MARRLLELARPEGRAEEIGVLGGNVQESLFAGGLKVSHGRLVEVADIV